MKKFTLEFLKRGLVAAWGGPLIIAIAYYILYRNGVIETLTIPEVCRGILSSVLLAFIAGGINAIYQTERLPLFTSIIIHCAVLYLDYILVYLINGWLQKQLTPILVFTAVFVAGFALIWLMIWQFTKRSVAKVNAARGQN